MNKRHYLEVIGRQDFGAILLAILPDAKQGFQGSAQENDKKCRQRRAVTTRHE
jgi:hypothetical protein